MAYTSILTLVSYNNGIGTLTFPVETVSFDVEQTLNIGSQSTGAGAGKIMFNPFVITRIPDIFSPKLFTICASGTPFKNATFSVTPDGATAPVLMYKLGLVAIKTISVSGNQHGGFLPVETVSFEYGALQFGFHDPVSEQTELGSWDRINNTGTFPNELL